MSETKEHNSRMYIGGMRLYTMKSIADAFFGEELIDVYIDTKEKIFVVKIESTVLPKQIKLFTVKHKLCKIIPFRKMDLAEICKDCK